MHDPASIGGVDEAHSMVSTSYDIILINSTHNLHDIGVVGGQCRHMRHIYSIIGGGLAPGDGPSPRPGGGEV